MPFFKRMCFFKLLENLPFPLPFPYWEFFIPPSHKQKHSTQIKISQESPLDRNKIRDSFKKLVPGISQKFIYWEFFSNFLKGFIQFFTLINSAISLVIPTQILIIFEILHGLLKNERLRDFFQKFFEKKIYSETHRKVN